MNKENKMNQLQSKNEQNIHILYSHISHVYTVYLDFKMIFLCIILNTQEGGLEDERNDKRTWSSSVSRNNTRELKMAAARIQNQVRPVRQLRAKNTTTYSHAHLTC